MISGGTVTESCTWPHAVQRASSSGYRGSGFPRSSGLMKEFARGCRPRSRTFASESAWQIRQRDLSVAHFPVVRDLRTERIEARDLGRIVWDRRAVRDDGVGMSDALEAVPDVGRDRDQRVITLADEDFLQLAACRRASAVVEEHELDRPERDRVVDRHALVEVPAFDDAGVDGREIDLTEALEMRVIRTKHVHDRPALVRDLTERDDANALDHYFSPRYARYHSIVARRPSSRDTRDLHPRMRLALSVERRCSLISFFAMLRTRGSGSWPPKSLAIAFTMSRTLTWAPDAKLKASPATSGRCSPSATATYAPTTSAM